MEDVTYPVHCQDSSLRRKMKKIQNKMHTLGERIQEYGVRISSFDLFQLNNSTTQPLNTSTFWCFHPHMVPQRGMTVYPVHSLENSVLREILLSKVFPAL